MRLTVLSRSYCHLCDDMIASLEASRDRFPEGYDVEVVDVDQHPALEAKWGDKVPVLLDGEVEISHYFLDLARLESHLMAAASRG
jgi:thioredoxin reductase (NADPH)